MASRKRTTSGKTTAAPRKRVVRKKPAADVPQVKENVAAAAPPGPVSTDEVRIVEIDGETVDLAAKRLAEEMQDLGVDVVPRGEIHVGGEDGARPAGGNAGVTLSDWDYHLFNEGSHHRLWEKLGAHVVDGGTVFAVWAPNAAAVSVIGDWNGWSRDANPLTSHGPSGIWEGFVPDIGKGHKYKFHIRSRHNNYSVDKADPFAVHAETPPHTASIVWDLEYEWRDEEWMAARGARNAADAPISIYEVHLGSWRRNPDDNNRPLSYREVAGPLAEYVRKMNFTHVELLPIMEHP